MRLEEIVRKNILNLMPYSSARDEFDGSSEIFLDANENPFGTFNRYPDPYQRALKLKLSAIKRVQIDEIFIGNGSDEIIDLTYRIFCEPGKDKALTFTPTYGMFDVSADINDVELLKVPLTDDFQIDLKATLEIVEKEKPKVIFICSPNNPTGNSLKSESIEALLNITQGIVVIDEAYIDFSTNPSWIGRLDAFPNLIISQTFSKARALAAARIGSMYASPQIVNLFNKVKPPYNISKLNMDAATKTLVDVESYETNVKLILSQRETLVKNLSELEMVKHIYPSDANFLLVKMEDANATYNTLVDKGIITRN